MDSTAPRMVPLRAAVAMVFATTAVFFAGVFAAHAWPGRAGEVRSSFTVAGILTLPAGAARPPTLRFVFHKSGAPDCAVDTRAEMPPTGDQFTAQIDYDACGRGFFDGSDVTADVLVNGAAVVSGQAVNPVPYAHFASVAGVARQYETPECPAGYTRDVSVTRWIVCQRSRADGSVADDVVRVGVGPSAFWIDRYEAIVYASTDGTGVMYVNGDWPAEFASNGQSALELYALSRIDGIPTRQITWFQAQRACRASGKRLPTGEEWLAAARGTPDTAASCFVSGSDTTLARVGAHPDCVSRWGAQDMVGNVWELTADWAAGPRVIRDDPASTRHWPTGYGDDLSENIAGFVNTGVVTPGIPAVVIRGGSAGSGTGAGVFALSVGFAPTAAYSALGFRCVIPR